MAVNQKKAPAQVFRYLADRDHAEAFCSGYIWLSTFNQIRHADSGRADKDDGQLLYSLTSVTPDTPAADREVIRHRIEPAIGEPLNDTLENVHVFRQHPDAYVLCTTLREERKMRDRFGQFCVRISHPYAFFKCVTSMLLEKGVLLEADDFAPVQYAGRSFADANPEVGQVAFANVPGNAFEREARMVWTPRSRDSLPPMLLHVPATVGMCSIV